MKGFFNDIVGQLWTLLGMFVAWVVLEGSAKDVIGWCIIITFGVWIATYPLRRSKDDQ